MLISEGYGSVELTAAHSLHFGRVGNTLDGLREASLGGIQPYS